MLQFELLVCAKYLSMKLAEFKISGNMLRTSSPRHYLVRPESRELGFPFNGGSLGKASPAIMCPVLSTACPSSPRVLCRRVSLGIWDRVWGGSKCVFLLRSEEGAHEEEDKEETGPLGENTDSF